MSTPASKGPEIPVPGVGGYLPLPSGRALFCVRHAAAAGTAARGAVVLWQTCSEERKASHRTMVRLGGALAAAGFDTVRIDLPGCGESTGALSGLRLQDWVADATAATQLLLAELLRTAPAEYAVWLGGLRLGATVAGLCALPGSAAGGRSCAPRWLAIAPILQGSGWLRHLRTRRSIRSEMTGADAPPATPAAAGGSGARAVSAPSGGEDFDGFTLSAGMVADLERLDLVTQLRLARGVVIQAGAAKTVTREFAALATAGRELTVQAIRQEPVWERGEAVKDQPLVEAVVAAVLAAGAGA